MRKKGGTEEFKNKQIEIFVYISAWHISVLWYRDANCTEVDSNRIM